MNRRQARKILKARCHHRDSTIVRARRKLGKVPCDTKCRFVVPLPPHVQAIADLEWPSKITITPHRPVREEEQLVDEFLAGQ